MISPEARVVYFEENDVIATSELFLTITGTYNGVSNDATFTFGGQTYSSSDLNLKVVNAFFGSGAWEKKLGPKTFGNVVTKDKSEDDTVKGKTTNNYNGTYIYDTVTKTFTKQ